MKSSSLSRMAIGAVVSLGSLGLVAAVLAPQDPDARQLATERYEAARAVWEHVAKKPWETTAECDTRALWSRRLAEAAAESGAVPTRDAFAQHVARMEEMLVAAKTLFEAGRSSVVDVAVAQFHVAEAKSLAKR